jgi:hypothetical protein
LFEIRERDSQPMRLVTKSGDFAQQLQVKGDLFDQARGLELKRPFVTPCCTEPKETKMRKHTSGGSIRLPAHHAVRCAKSYPFPILWVATEKETSA